MYVNGYKTLFAICVILTKINFSYSCSQDKRPAISLKGNISRTYQGITFLQYGGSLEIFCTAQDELVLGASNDTTLVILDTEKMNKTTVKYVIEKTQKQLLKLTCVVKDDFDCAHALIVVADDQPEIKNFKCISKNLDYLNCTWSSTNFMASFSLEVLYKEKPAKICATDETQMYCTWTNYDIPLYAKHEKTFHFIMKTCSCLGICKKTKFDIVHLSIVKLNPPTNLKVLKKNSHSVVLKWEIPYRQYSALDGVDYRIDYWYSGIQPREVNTSSVINKFTSYQFEMQLPCADTFYEVKVRMKPKQATDEELWSDFVSISFVTEGDEIDVNNVTCQKQRVVLTANIMVYELKKFKMKLKEEQSMVKRRISELKAKTARKYED